MESEAGGRRMLLCAVALGQLCCLLLTITGVTSHVLAEKGASLPTTQSALNYGLLGLVFGVAGLRQKEQAQHPLWKYMLLAFFDVEANFLVVMAYRYTSITSVSLSSAFSVPTVMLLSSWILGSRYRKMHVVGAALAVAGLVYLVLSDKMRGADTTAGTSPLFGDLLVIAGASMYAGTNVVQEHLLGSAKLVEVMGRLGMLGFLLSVAQAFVVEGTAFRKVDWLDPSIGLSLAAFVAALFVYYNVEPFILKLGGSTTLNLSLLAANFWDAGARVIFLGGFSGAAARDFSVSLLLVALGLVSYSFAGPVKVAGRKESRRHEDDDVEGVCDDEAESRALILEQRPSASELVMSPRSEASEAP